MRSLRRTIMRLRTRTPMTITRTTAAALVKGRHVPGVTSTFAIKGSIQPLTDKEIQNLPEGLRTSAKFALFTNVVLVVEPDADQLDYKDVTYTVQATQDWTDTADYARYVLVKNEVAT